MRPFPHRLHPTLSAVHHGVRYYVAGLGKRLFTLPVPLWAQAIAFKVLVTLLPLILLATGVFGLVVRQADPFETIAGWLRTFLPPQQSEQLVAMIFRLQQASGTLTLVGAAFFIATVITLFATLRYVVTAAMGSGTPRETRSLLRGYAFDLRMAVQVGLLFLASFLLTFGLRFLSAQTLGWADDLGLDGAPLARGWGVLLQVLGLVIPYVLSWGVFAQLFYFAPRPKPPLRSALLGAAVTAVLFELAKNGFAFYARYIGNFERYTSSTGDALSSLGGVFGLILALVFWVYLSGWILIVGAIVTGLNEQRVNPRRSAMRRLWRTLRFRVRGHDESAAEPAAEPATDPTASPDQPAGGTPEPPENGKSEGSGEDDAGVAAGPPRGAAPGVLPARP